MVGLVTGSTVQQGSAQNVGSGGGADGTADAAASGERGRTTVLDPAVQELRSFNRFYTNLIGALDYSRHLYVPYTLTEARVLYELAHSPRTDAADLRAELSLDAGYLSRLLAKFEKDKLVERAPSERDSRRQSITLTEEGRSAAKLLDERSQERVATMLDTLPAPERARLAAAMRTIREILAPDSRTRRRPRRDDIRLRAPQPGDLGWMVQRNAALYAAEYGWNREYEALVARIVADFAAHHDPRFERVWIAELDGRPVGSVMCVRDDHGGGTGTAAGGGAGSETTSEAGITSEAGAPGAGATSEADPPGNGATREAGATSGTDVTSDRPGTARLRLLLVEPDARGCGVGDRLVTTCIDFARASGYDEMVLWTNDILTTARRIYQRHGFTLTAEQPHHSFGVDLVGQDWHLRL